MTDTCRKTLDLNVLLHHNYYLLHRPLSLLHHVVVGMALTMRYVFFLMFLHHHELADNYILFILVTLLKAGVKSFLMCNSFLRIFFTPKRVSKLHLRDLHLNLFLELRYDIIYFQNLPLQID